MATDAGLTHVHYCTWGFQTGVRNYRAGLEAGTKIVAGAVYLRVSGLERFLEHGGYLTFIGE